jgi:hypothetical protein
MRQEGFRLLQVWVPDTSAPGFAAEARRQAELVARAAAAEDTMDWVEAVAAPWDE